MAEGFTKVEVPDPSKITSFIEDTTGAVVAIFEVSQQLQFLSNP